MTVQKLHFPRVSPLPNGSNGRCLSRHQTALTVTLIASLCLGVSMVKDLKAGGEDEPPVAGRPVNYSEIVGQYRIAASASPTAVSVEDPITLTVRIQGTGPSKFQPARDKLRIFPAEFQNDFYLEPLKEKDRQVKDTWEFAYRLRPKHEDVKFIPGLKLVYYHPARKKYQSSFADAIAITVKPRAEVKPPPDVAKAVKPPDRFFELITGPEVLERWEPSWLARPVPLLVMALLPPLLCGLYYGWWRWRSPDARRLVRDHRSRAARQALDSLHNVDGDATRVVVVMLDYLRRRLDLPGAEPTPSEVARHLRRIGVSRELQKRFATLFAACDERRFSLASAPQSLASGGRKPPEDGAPSPGPVPQGANAPRSPEDYALRSPLAADAVHLIHALEAEPCLA